MNVANMIVLMLFIGNPVLQVFLKCIIKILPIIEQQDEIIFD